MSEATDRLPPQALDMEAAVLGSMMLDPQAAGVALELLRPDDFYRSAHRLIFEAAQELAAADQPIDHGLLARKLEEKQTLGT
ncbi:MAG: DnaB-like helicase N-terminal domain-containing protein, partial [Planctomycetota bacterium]